MLLSLGRFRYTLGAHGCKTRRVCGTGSIAFAPLIRHTRPISWNFARMHQKGCIAAAVVLLTNRAEVVTSQAMYAVCAWCRAAGCRRVRGEGSLEVHEAYGCLSHAVVATLPRHHHGCIRKVVVGQAVHQAVRHGLHPSTFTPHGVFAVGTCVKLYGHPVGFKTKLGK